MRRPQLCVDLGGKRAAHVTTIPAIFKKICDDAALFPPGNASMADAIPMHRNYRSSLIADAVGPFVLPSSRVPELAVTLTHGKDSRQIELAVTCPNGPEGLETLLVEASDSAIPNIGAVEIAIPPDTSVSAAFRTLAAVSTAKLNVFVEVPRDARQSEVIASLAGSSYRAKFRTGGVSADAYPDATELARSICAVASFAVPFKATAGLHHAVRNTDPATEFEQHGFLNVILAVDAAISGANPDEVAVLLESRNEREIVNQLLSFGPERTARVRAQFVSFGTCNVIEPLCELATLGLFPLATLVEFQEKADA